MPELFPDTLSFVLASLVMAGAQFIYATVGFGAGMFAVALLACLLPDLGGVVALQLLVTAVTEVFVLWRAWREVNWRLLVGLLPCMAIGLWLGTQVLVTGDVGLLKRLLGLVVAGAGLWFLRSGGVPTANGEAEANHGRASRSWIVPVGLFSGVLGGLFGTGGPPVIVYLRGFRMPKGPFRATLIAYFFAMTAFRFPIYVHESLLTGPVVWAAAYLMPAGAAGIVAGMVAHRKIPERQFAHAVSILLFILGVLLAAGVGR